MNMEVKQAEYVATYVDVNKCPDTFMPEYAMIGRSNVGKSSLINYICHHKGLAKVSATPGKTQTINYFVINNTWHLRKKWAVMIENYLLKRKQLQYVFILIDSRIPPQESDMNFINFLGENNLPFVIVFTKADKPGGKETLYNIELFKKVLHRDWDELPDMFVTSSERKYGKELILAFIDESNKEFSTAPKPPKGFAAKQKGA
jgi:GTP-binding protein